MSPHEIQLAASSFLIGLVIGAFLMICLIAWKRSRRDHGGMLDLTYRSRTYDGRDV